MSYALEFDLEVDAQAAADDVHANMIAGDPNYAASVAAGATTGWATPYQIKDEFGVVVPGSKWYINVKERAEPYMPVIVTGVQVPIP